MHAFEIGQRFIRYYQNDGFKVLPRSSLLDPSLPMTFVGSAGLAQIESAIEQGEDRAGERYVLLQTCFRHFDVEKVGQSPVHLSLFEMGGAFAFGKEKKENTLQKIWSFLTGELGFDEKKLWATCFAGGDLDGHQFEADRETFQAWCQIGLPPTRIVDMGTEGAFWKQGGGLSGRERFRKCGPTTEIFFDRGPQWRCGSTCQPGCNCGRFIEMANVLFIHWQIDQVTRSLRPLVTPFAESVIGVERVAMSLEEKSSVFDLECLASLVKLVRLCHQSTDRLVSPKSVASTHIIADHLRALLFLVADGAPPPGKGGQRRIIKILIRGILTHQKILRITRTCFILNLVEAALELYQSQYPCLARCRSVLLDYFDRESKRFEKTLAAGYRQLDRVVQWGVNGSISGQQSLALVKQHGIPLPLLKARLAQMDIKFNKQAYWEAHAHWRQKTQKTQKRQTS